MFDHRANKKIQATSEYCNRLQNWDCVVLDFLNDCNLSFLLLYFLNFSAFILQTLLTTLFQMTSTVPLDFCLGKTCS